MTRVHFTFVITVAFITGIHIVHAHFCRKDDRIVTRNDHEVCTFSQHIENDCKSAGPFYFGTDVVPNSLTTKCVVMNHTITCS
ncbi:unnamed protein product, partial [Cylicocyclus nassatus]